MNSFLIEYEFQICLKKVNQTLFETKGKIKLKQNKINFQIILLKLKNSQLLNIHKLKLKLI